SVERKRNPELFKAPILIVKAGLTSDFKVVGSISYSDIIFTKSVYGLKQYGSSKILEMVLGILSSHLFNYYILLIGSSTGIERETINDEEINSFSFKYSEKIIISVLNLIKLNRLIEIHKRKPLKENLKIVQYEKQFEEKEAELNQFIFDLYNLSDTEKDLIAYAQEITIPVLQAKNKKYREVCEDARLYKPYKALEKSELENYINIYQEHFLKFHSGGTNGYFNVRVFQSKNIIAIEFYIDKKKQKDEWINEPDTAKTMEKLATLGFQKVSNDLFIQKDTKTLNRDSFSVVKLNQYKYWHKAIARLDVIEFTEAMIKSQIEPQDGKNQ
ncbi:MAG: hypothetical protein P1P88_18065, partial [Bacteroidales bacterium]|nr:hypothetical protein [Bacteroidales bacterium]